MNRAIPALLCALFAALVLPAVASAVVMEPSASSPIRGIGTFSDVATGDFDEDGKSDLVAAVGTSELNNGLLVQLSDGDGSFTTGMTVDPGENGYFSVFTGDFNGDGHLDLIGSRYFPGGIRVSLGDGDGGFQFAATIGTIHNGFASRSSFAVADLDGDGDDDFVSGNGTGAGTIALSNGDGTFATTSFPLAGGSLNAAAIGDFNGDGDLDAAFGEAGGAVYLLRGDGTGTFSDAGNGNPHPMASPTGTIDSISAGDFDGDGLDDLAASAIDHGGNGRSGSVQTWLGDSDDMLASNPAADGRFTSPDRPSHLIAADWDLDGEVDLGFLEYFVPNGPPEWRVALALGNGDGSFRGPAETTFPIGLAGGDVWGAAKGDFDGNGAPDLVGANPYDGCEGCGSPVVMNVARLKGEPGDLGFGSVKVGDDSTTTLGITNLGAPDADVSSISITGTDPGEFSRSAVPGSCVGAVNGEVPGNGSCAIDITFHPGTAGQKSATLVIAHDGSSSPLEIPLTGTGTVPVGEFDRGSVEFGPVRTGTTSAAETITITSSGDAPIEFSSVQKSGGNSSDFSVTGDTCSGTSKAPGQTCTIAVTMAPGATGARSTSLLVPNDGQSTPQAVSLAGEGINPGISLTPTSYDFGPTEIGGIPATKDFTVSSTGSTALTLDGITIDGADSTDFEIEQPPGCTGSLAPGGSCTVTVEFEPGFGEDDARTATLEVASNVGADAVSALSGTATYGDLTTDPGQVDLDEQRVGTTGTARRVTVTSTGTAPLQIHEIEPTGADAGRFGVTDDQCTGATVAIGETCTFGVTFSPDRTGQISGELRLQLNAGAGTLDLTGTGIDPRATISPASHDFGSATIGSGAADLPSQTFEVTSTGATPLTVGTATITGDAAGSFRLDDATPCPGEAPTGAKCRVEVTFDPGTGAPGPRNAELAIETNAGPVTAQLSGTAAAPPNAALSLRLKSAGKVKRGKKLKLTATVKNSGSVAVTGLSLKAAVAKKLARAPKAVKIATVAPGATVRRTVKVPVKKTARAGGKLKVTVTASAGGRKLASARRSVKVRK